MALALNHQTPAEFQTRFWNKVKAAKKSGNAAEYHRCIWWMWNQIQSGNMTHDQVRSGYNAAYDKSVNAGEWNALVLTRIVPMKDRHLAALAEEDL